MPARNNQVVTYAWDMHELHAFLKRRPLIGASLQKAMAEDFINKVYQSRGHEERYRLLLVESLDPGSINPIGREKLRRYLRGRSTAVAVVFFPTTALVSSWACCMNRALSTPTINKTLGVVIGWDRWR